MPYQKFGVLSDLCHTARMTFDFLAILTGLGATVLGLGAWSITFAHSNEAGQQAILTLLGAIGERDKMEKLQGNGEMVHPPTFLSSAGELPPNSCLPPLQILAKPAQNGGKTAPKHAKNTPKSRVSP